MAGRRIMNKQEFMKKHNQRIMDEIKRSPLNKLIDRITNTKRDIYGYRVFNDETTRDLVMEYLETVKDEIDVTCLANHLDIHWLRVKQVMYTQHLTSAGMRRESLINGWTPVWRDFHIYFKRTQVNRLKD